MVLNIRGAFFRDWDKTRSKKLSKAIEEKKREVISAHNLSQISCLKKLRTRELWYKIELRLSPRKIYWILCVCYNNRIEFVRVKSEKYFKKKILNILS